jgi:hypothetical protein
MRVIRIVHQRRQRGLFASVAFLLPLMSTKASLLVTGGQNGRSPVIEAPAVVFTAVLGSDKLVCLGHGR